MVKLLKQRFDIFALRKTKGQRVDYKLSGAVNDNFNKKPPALTERKTISLKPKDDRTYERWMTIWRLDTRD